MIDVLIVDDHPVMRELLCQVLETYADISVIAEVASGEDAVTQVAMFQPAIALARPSLV
jgi:DNA-binding NarL/FixJ family response regulator